MSRTRTSLKLTMKTITQPGTQPHLQATSTTWPLKLLLAILLPLLAGCARYTIERTVIPDQNWGACHHDNKGYVFYQPELYFSVTAEPAKETKPGEPNPVQYTVKPVYLPNYAKPYKLTTCNFLAKSDFTFNFTDGWQLTSISDKSDNSTLASAIAGQLSTILTAAAALTKGEPQKRNVFLLHPTFTNGIISGLDPFYLPAPK